MRMNKKWTLALSGALAIALLSGCGAKSDSTAAGQPAQQDQGGNGAGQAWQGRGGMGMGMTDENGNPASLMGKVKSISGQTITVYKSSFDPSQMPQGGNRRSGGNGQNGNGQAGGGNGQAPAGNGASNGSGQAAGSDGQSGGGQQPNVGGQALNGGNGTNGSGNRPQGGGMANMFTDETEDITVSDATKIESVSYENGQTTTKELALSDLKADDVLTIWLKEGTQEAATIRVGGFGGGFGGGNRGQWQGGQGQQGGQNQQQPSQSTDSQSAAANG